MPKLALVLDDVRDPASSAPSFDAPSEPANANGPSAAAPSAATDAEALDAYSRAVVDVIERVGPAVVSIGRMSKRGPAGAGSGVVFTPDGYVLTNAHVVAGSDALEVGFSDGTTSAARVVGVDHATDVAVVRAA